MTWKGPHTLTTHNVRRRVDEDEHGIYMLYNTWGGPPRYVGRSHGKNLSGRLQKRAREDDYRYFKYEYASSKARAFEHEANLWHRHGSTIENAKHPDRPHKNVVCSRCSYPH